jgi:hypothetical protein
MSALYGLIREIENTYTSGVEGFEVEDVHVEISAGLW